MPDPPRPRPPTRKPSPEPKSGDELARAQRKREEAERAREDAVLELERTRVLDAVRQQEIEERDRRIAELEERFSRLEKTSSRPPVAQALAPQQPATWWNSKLVQALIPGLVGLLAGGGSGHMVAQETKPGPDPIVLHRLAAIEKVQADRTAELRTVGRQAEEGHDAKVGLKAFADRYYEIEMANEMRFQRMGMAVERQGLGPPPDTQWLNEAMPRNGRPGISKPADVRIPPPPKLP